VDLIFFLPVIQTAVALSAAFVFCPETECSPRILCDESQQTRLDRQSSGLGRRVPHLDDVRLLFARSAGFHPHLHGDSDHHVSNAASNLNLDGKSLSKVDCMTSY